METIAAYAWGLVNGLWVGYLVFVVNPRRPRR